MGEKFVCIGLTLKKSDKIYMYDSESKAEVVHVPHQFFSQGKFSFMFSSFKCLPCLSYKKIQIINQQKFPISYFCFMEKINDKVSVNCFVVHVSSFLHNQNMLWS